MSVGETGNTDKGHSRRLAPIVLSMAGVILSVVSIVTLLPRFESVTVEKPVIEEKRLIEVRERKFPVTVEGKQHWITVPETASRIVLEPRIDAARVEPTAHERVWLYAMVAMGGFLLVFAVGTAFLWFYFLVRKNGEPPQIVTEMLKYLVASFMGIFVGFMGGTAVGVDRQMTLQKPETRPARPGEPPSQPHEIVPADMPKPASETDIEDPLDRDAEGEPEVA